MIELYEGEITMSFTVICNKCDSKVEFKQGDSQIKDPIDFDVTERSSWAGSEVETIDIYCWKCNNEINM